MSRMTSFTPTNFHSGVRCCLVEGVSVIPVQPILGSQRDRMLLQSLLQRVGRLKFELFPDARARSPFGRFGGHGTGATRDAILARWVQQ